jgi:hypothetical protein
VQNGEKGFDKRKTQLMQHEYLVFHVLNLCPPDDIMVKYLRVTKTDQCRLRYVYSQ